MDFMVARLDIGLHDHDMLALRLGVGFALTMLAFLFSLALFSSSNFVLCKVGGQK